MSAEPLSSPAQSPKKNTTPVPDLDIDDLLEQPAPAVVADKNIGLLIKNPIMLPSARCDKGRLLAESDLFLSSGKLAVRAGQPLNVNSAELFARKKMKECPLELEVSHGELGLSQLLADFEILIKKVSGFAAFVEMNGGSSKWKRMLGAVLSASGFALVYLAQLRRYSLQCYEQSLFCSWMASQLAERMTLNQEKVRHLLLAGLYHQVGRLHLPEALRSITENHCEADDWNILQGHVIFGKLLLKDAGDVGLAPVTEIIAQQGEYANSLGYPFSLPQDQLRQESIVLSLSRELYQFLFVDEGSLADCLLFLQLHEVRFGEEASWAMQRQIKAFLAEQPSDPDLVCTYSEKMADYLIETSIILAQLHVLVSLVIGPVRLGLAKSEKAYLVERVVILLQQIDFYKNNSGIIDLGFLACIDSMQNEEAGSLDAELYQIIQQQRGLLTLFSEMDFLLESAIKFMSKKGKPEVLKEVVGLYEAIHDELEPFNNAMKKVAR